MNPAFLWLYGGQLSFEFFLTIQVFQRFLPTANSQKHLIQLFCEFGNLSISAFYRVIYANKICWNLIRKIRITVLFVKSRSGHWVENYKKG